MNLRDVLTWVTLKSKQINQVMSGTNEQVTITQSELDVINSMCGKLENAVKSTEEYNKSVKCQ